MKYSLLICLVLAFLSGCLNRTGVKSGSSVSKADSINEAELLDIDSFLFSRRNDEEDIKLRKEKEKLDSLIALKPNHGEYYYRRGETNFGLLRFHHSTLDFKNSIRLGYKERNAALYLAYIYGFMDIPDSVAFYQAYADRFK